MTDFREIRVMAPTFDFSAVQRVERHYTQMLQDAFALQPSALMTNTATSATEVLERSKPVLEAIREMRARMEAPRPPVIFLSRWLADPVPDWSRVRSPSRARRRLAQGHRQNIRTMWVAWDHAVSIAGNIHIHPDLWERVKGKLESEARRSNPFFTGYQVRYV